MPPKKKKSSDNITITFDQAISLADSETLQLNLRFLQNSNQPNAELISKISARITELADPLVEQTRREELSKIRDKLKQTQKDIHFRAVNREKTGAGRNLLSGTSERDEDVLRQIIHADEQYRYEDTTQLSHLVRFMSDENQEVLLEKIMLLQNPGYKEFMNNSVNAGLLDAIKMNNVTKFDENLDRVSGKDLELFFSIPQYPSLEMQRKIYDSRSKIQAKINSETTPNIPSDYRQIIDPPIANIRGANQQFPSNGVESLLPRPRTAIDNPSHGNLRGFQELNLPKNEIADWKKNATFIPATVGTGFLLGTAAAYVAKKVFGGKKKPEKSK